MELTNTTEKGIVRTIPGFPDYAITKDGRVRSKPRKNTRGHNLKGRWLKLVTNAPGYHVVNLYLNSQVFSLTVHRLVLETYVGPCPKGKECRHLNSIRTDNRLENLCWGTPKENQQDSIRHGTHCCLRQGNHHNGSKLTEQDVRMIIYIYRTELFLQREIAKSYKISTEAISAIISKKSWGCIWRHAK